MLAQMKDLAKEQVKAAVGPLIDPVKALVSPNSPMSIEGLKEKAKEAVTAQGEQMKTELEGTVQTMLDEKLAAAGVPGTPANEGEVSNAAEEARTEIENSENENQGGGGYEIVTLSSPVEEPLFVCYQSGKPVYFTNSSRGLNILPLHGDMEARYTVKNRGKKRKAPTKKASKKSSKKRSKKNSRKRRT